MDQGEHAEDRVGVEGREGRKSGRGGGEGVGQMGEPGAEEGGDCGGGRVRLECRRGSGVAGAVESGGRCPARCAADSDVAICEGRPYNQVRGVLRESTGADDSNRAVEEHLVDVKKSGGYAKLSRLVRTQLEGALEILGRRNVGGRERVEKLKELLDEK